MATSGQEDSLLHIVECDICTEIMDHPLALACLHHFCEACSKKLQRVHEDGVTGVHCPQCRKFTSENKIQHSFLMNNLVEMFHKKQLKHGHDQNVEKMPNCKQCNSQEVVSICKTCEIELCSNCKTGHLNIPVCQNHKIVDAYDDSDITLSITEDEFCPKHPSNLVKYNCVTCDKAVCADCKILEHDEHKTEGIDKTIDRMVQQSKQNLKAITTKKDQYEKLLDEVNSFQEKCLLNHDKTKQNIETHTQNVSCIIQKCSQKIVDKENKGFAAISDAINMKRAELGYQITSRENIITEVNTVIGMTTGLPLLTTLKESDFTAKYVDPIVEINSFTDIPSVQFKPEDQPNENYIEQLACQLFGIAKTAQKDEQGKEKVPVYDRSSQDADKMALFAIAKKTMVVKVSSRNIETACQRLCYFRGQFWCPHSKNGSNKINVFNNSLNLIHTLYLDKVNWPYAVSPISANQLIVAAGNGLYGVTVDSAIVKQLITGNFVDVQSNKDITVALEKVQAGNDKIYVFANKDEPIQESSFELDNDIGTTIALSDSHVWVSSYHSTLTKAKSYLTRYDAMGNNLSQVGAYGKNKPGELYDPRLCLADANGSILVADHWNYRLQVLDSAERWNIVGKIKGVERPLDVKLTSDGCLCVLWYNKYDSSCHLTLYKS